MRATQLAQLATLPRSVRLHGVPCNARALFPRCVASRGQATTATTRPLASSSLLAKLAPKDVAEFPEDSIYRRRTADDLLRDVRFPVEDPEDPYCDTAFRLLVNDLFQRHRPSEHLFFRDLREAPSEVVRDSGFLTELYTRYQAAMHVTRTMVYMAPCLHVPSLRQRKVDIIVDDDALGGKASHHQQLEHMFADMGANPPSEEYFGSPQELERQHRSPGLRRFFRTVDRLYTASTGAWCVAEVLSDDWLSALALALRPHYPWVLKAQYFDEVFSGHVEIRHMIETVSLTEAVFARYPSMRGPTFAHAQEMCRALDDLWDDLRSLVHHPEAVLSGKTVASGESARPLHGLSIPGYPPRTAAAAE